MPDAIVLAGGGAESGLDPGTPNKGFIRLAGRPRPVPECKAFEKAHQNLPPGVRQASPNTLLKKAR